MTMANALVPESSVISGIFPFPSYLCCYLGP